MWFQLAPKNGRSRGNQRYRCQQCLYHFTLDSKHPHQPERVKNMAVSTYAEENSIEAISRVLGMKAGTVYSWIKKSLPARYLLRITGEQRRDRSRGRALPKVISFDEMWSYAGARRRGKRRECWVWMAAVEEPDGRRWVDFEVGDRSKDTFLRLYGCLPGVCRQMCRLYSGSCSGSGIVVPAFQLRLQFA